MRGRISVRWRRSFLGSLRRGFWLRLLWCFDASQSLGRARKSDCCGRGGGALRDAAGSGVCWACRRCFLLLRVLVGAGERLGGLLSGDRIPIALREACASIVLTRKV